MTTLKPFKHPKYKLLDTNTKIKDLFLNSSFIASLNGIQTSELANPDGGVGGDDFNNTINGNNAADIMNS